MNTINITLSYDLILKHDSSLINNWEYIWRSYVFSNLTSAKYFKLSNKKIDALKVSIKSSNYMESSLLIKDALDIINDILITKNMTVCFTYISDDETMHSINKQQSLIGVCQLLQSLKARNVNNIKIQVKTSKLVWNSIIFDNKSHMLSHDILITD